MVRVGKPCDDGMMESFFKTLKHEKVYLSEYETCECIVLRLLQLIEEVYNWKRLHSALGYLSPEEHEKSLPQYDNQAEATRTSLTISVQR